MNNFYKQIWTALKIWWMAVAIDTTIGSLFLTAGFSGEGATVLDFIEMYVVLSALFSFPIFLAMVIILNRCKVNEVPSHRAFLIVLLSGIGLTILMFAIFLAMIGEVDKMYLGHFLVALLSGFAAIMLQYASIRKIVDTN